MSKFGSLQVFADTTLVYRCAVCNAECPEGINAYHTERGTYLCKEHRDSALTRGAANEIAAALREAGVKGARALLVVPGNWRHGWRVRYNLGGRACYVNDAETWEREGAALTGKERGEG